MNTFPIVIANPARSSVSLVLISKVTHEALSSVVSVLFANEMSSFKGKDTL
jgi:hypothetical protein